jgi:hypothetical protein
VTDAKRLTLVRSVQTAIYAAMACSVFAVFYAGLVGARGEWLVVALVLVAIEVLVFVGSGMKCPLTALAVKYGADRAPLVRRAAVALAWRRLWTDARVRRWVRCMIDASCRHPEGAHSSPGQVRSQASDDIQPAADAATGRQPLCGDRFRSRYASGDVNMATRVTTKMLTFRRPFRLDEIERELPAGTYAVETEEETIDGISFLAYRRVSTSLIVRSQGGAGNSAQMWMIHPDGLEMALERDRADA